MVVKIFCEYAKFPILAIKIWQVNLKEDKHMLIYNELSFVGYILVFQ